MLRVELPLTPPAAAADDEIEIDDDATITAPSTPVAVVQSKKRQPRCPNGTRRNKRSGLCVKYKYDQDKTKNVPNVNVSIKEGVQTSPKRKRCAKGSRRARSGPHKGECVNYIEKQTFSKAANDAANAVITNDANDAVISTMFTGSFPPNSGASPEQPEPEVDVAEWTLKNPNRVYYVEEARFGLSFKKRRVIDPETEDVIGELGDAEFAELREMIKRKDVLGDIPQPQPQPQPQSTTTKALPIENVEPESESESESVKSPKTPEMLESYEDHVSLYPTLDDADFNRKITNKKEFFDTRYERMDDLTIEEYANKMCSASDNFELAPHQLFVRNFLSSTTPYKSLLLYHGLGTGKTCSAISVAEEMREYFKRMGISKRIYVVASPTVKLNFKLQLFNKDKLVLNRSTGTWSMNTCVGNKLLKDNGLAIASIPTSEISQEQEEQMKDAISKNISAIIKSTYSFIGYEKLKTMIEQSIYGTNKADYKKLDQLTESQIAGIKKRFDDALIIIDEVHNLRTTEDKNKSNDKMTGKLLTVVAKYSQNMRLLLLTATPMYNNPKEIIWLLNLMRINDNRSEIKYSDVFVGDTGEETIKTSTDDDPSRIRSAYSSGKDVLKNASYGYVSYVRGENPFTFPYRIYPKVHSPQHSFFADPGAAVPHPTIEYTGTRIDTMKKFLDVYVTSIGTEQRRVYELCIKQLMGNAEPPVQSQSREAHESDSDSDSGDNDDGDDNDSDFGENEEEEGFGDADTPAAAAATAPAFADQPQKPGAGANGDYDEIAAKFGVESYTALQALTMSYPSRSLQQQQNPKTSVGKAGLMQVVDRVLTGGMRYRYRANVEHVFAPENIGKWSNKIASVCKHAIECDGILLVYTQYIEGGAVPIALALEEHGFSRYKEDRANSNILDGSAQRARMMRGYYTLITGNNDLSPTASIQSAISAATHSSNKDGHIIKVIIITKAGSEGLDFKNVRQVHILDPWYNLSLLEQIIGRAVRNCSHVDLPFEQRNVCIFIHGTRLTDELGVDVDVEAIDLSLFRYAENKAKRIGNVNNILKKHAIDCNLNSEYNIPAFKGGVGTITQVLTTRGDDNVFRSIQHDASVMPRTDACDYQDICDSVCEPNVNMSDPMTGTDVDTYDMAFLTLNSERVIHRIRSLFKERFFYSEAELIGAINQVRTYPDEQIMTALNTLIDDPIEFITDYYGRRGRLINIGDYYLFQPEGVSDRHIGIRERVMPLESVADHVEYEQYEQPDTTDFMPEEGEAAGISQFDSTMGNLFNVYTAVTTGTKIRGAAVDDVFIQHAPELCRLILQATRLPREILVLAIMSHYLDMLDYKIAIDVANQPRRSTDPSQKEFLECITSYFMRHSIRTTAGIMVALPSEGLNAWSEEKVVGVLKGDGLEARITDDYVEHADFMMLEDSEWTLMTDRIRSQEGVGRDLFKWCDALKKKITTISSINNVIGCVRPETDTFVFKLIDITVSNELKGARPTKRTEQLEKPIFQLLALIGIDKHLRQSQSGEIIVKYVEKSTLEPLAVLLEIILRAYDIMEVDAGPDPSNSNPKSAHRNRWFLRPCEIQAITKINQIYKKHKK